MPHVAELLPLVVALAEHEVDFVLVGGAAGIVHGSSYATYDLDVAYARDDANLERLAGALRSLRATLRGASNDLPFLLEARTLKEGGSFTFDTRLGPLDVLGYPAGSPAYERLRADAEVVELAGFAVRVASLDHLIRMKEAAGRPKDDLMATEYRVLADERRSLEG